MELISCEEGSFPKERLLTIYNLPYNLYGQGSFGDDWVCKWASPITPGLLPTHWAPLPTLPKKKRWKPKLGEIYLSLSGSLINKFEWANTQMDNKDRESFGCYKTKEDAHAMLDKIKAFVTEEIGEP